MNETVNKYREQILSVIDMPMSEDIDRLAELLATSDNLAEALRIVLNNLMYKDYPAAIDHALKILAEYEASKGGK